MSETTELIAQQILNGNINKRTWGDILYNVKVYGAKGDWNTVTSTGTDDTAAIQATIDYAISVGGKAVFFPHGTYKVTALTNLSSVVLFGDNAVFSGITDTITQIGGPATSGTFYNVEDYGVKGDGITNGGPSLQSLVTTTIGSNKGDITFPPGSFKMSTNVNLGSNVALDFMKGANLIFDAGISMSPAPLTNLNGDFGHSIRNTGYSGWDIYNAIFGSVKQYDTFQAVTEIAPGSSLDNVTGVAGYIRNMSTNNGVALSGMGYAGVDNSAIWGINTLLQDSDTRAPGTNTGRKLSNEFDFNVMNTGTQVMGLSIGGNSLAKANLALGFIANALGNGFKWDIGFMAQDECCDIALYVGKTKNTGATFPSQKIRFVSQNQAGFGVTNDLYTSWNGWLIAETELFKVSFGSLGLDSGFGVNVNGIRVITDQQPAVANATDAATVITQLNALLARLRTHGLIAP